MREIISYTVIICIALLMLHCKSSDKQTSNQTKQDTSMILRIKSTAFDEGGMIPKKYTCDGENISPPLQWNTITSTKSYALINDDPDAPAGTWVHWVIYNIPSSVSELPEAVPVKKNLDNGAIQGVNDFGMNGYGGPCPPSGTHRYYFKLYALDTTLTLQGEIRKNELLEAMKGHIIAEGQLMGKYSRER